MSFKMTSSGSLARTKNWLRRIKFNKEVELLEEYGQMCVEALIDATPIDTGKTALSWDYEIIRDMGGNVTLQILNHNVKDFVPIAIIIQNGHATKSGGWVEGTDYINPAIQPIFDQIIEEKWKEVTRS